MSWKLLIFSITDSIIIIIGLMYFFELTAIQSLLIHLVITGILSLIGIIKLLLTNSFDDLWKYSMKSKENRINDIIKKLNELNYEDHFTDEQKTEVLTEQIDELESLKKII